MMMALLRWALNAAALMILPGLVGGISVTSFTSALFAALLIALFNALIRPVLIVLTLPITALTLGLFILVINALLFWAASRFVGGFHVTDFWSALWGALLYSLLTWLVSLALGGKRR